MSKEHIDEYEYLFKNFKCMKILYVVKEIVYPDSPSVAFIRKKFEILK